MIRKFLPTIRSKSLTILIICLCSSTAFLSIPKFWNELSEADAKKQMLDIPSWAPLVKKIQPAVVVITTEAMVQNAPVEFPGLPGPYRFFMPNPPEKQRGQGSGFIYDEEGYIITNQHVIDGAQKIKVTIGENPREYDAQKIGEDEELDIAIIKIVLPEAEAKTKKIWPALPLGDSDKLQLGDPLMAMGSPLGLTQSVNTGIVSQKQRGNIKPSGRDLDIELIQMQMPINPGNSGGPVVDVAGRVVGISESIHASGQSIAFCVPINIIKTIIPQLRQFGQIDKSFLGVDVEPLDSLSSIKLGLPSEQIGVRVRQVLPGTPAEKAGLKGSDVILELDNQKVTSPANLRQQIRYKGVGQTITLKTYRKTLGIRDIKIKLEKRPGLPTSVITPHMEIMGLEIADTPDYLKKELKLDAKHAGAHVKSVARNSVAEHAGILAGDVITEFDDIAISKALQLKELITKAPHNSALFMTIRRGNTKLSIKLEKRKLLHEN